MRLFKNSPVLKVENINISQVAETQPSSNSCGPPTTELIIQVNSQSVEQNPRKFVSLKKFLIVFVYTCFSIGVQLSSSITGILIFEIAEHYNTTIWKASLPTPVFLFGMGINIVICGPLTELHGRKNVVCISTFCSGVLTTGSAFIENFDAYLVTRFVAGILGAPASLAGGAVIHDLYDEKGGLYVLLFMSICISSMPSLAGVFAKKSIEWGLINSVNLINLVPGTIIIIFGILSIWAVDETYLPVKTKRLVRHINRHESFKKRIIREFSIYRSMDETENFTQQSSNLRVSQILPKDSHVSITEYDADANMEITTKGLSKSEISLDSADPDLKNVLFKSSMEKQEIANNGYFGNLRVKLLFPYKLLGEGLVMMLNFFCAYFTGSMYFFVTSLPSFIQKKYSDDEDIANNLNRIEKKTEFLNPKNLGSIFTLGLVFLGGGVLLTYSIIFTNQIVKTKQYLPEMRLIPLLIGSFLISIATFLTYFSGKNFQNYIYILIAEFLHGAGYYLAQQSIIIYLVDIYNENSASACSLYFVFRNFISGIVPFVGNTMILYTQNKGFLGIAIFDSVIFLSMIFIIIKGYVFRMKMEYCIIKSKFKEFS